MTVAKILLIDDDPVLLKELGDYLRGMHYQVVTRRNAQQATEELSSLRPDEYQLVLLNWMPKTRNKRTEVMERIKSINPSLPVIVTGDYHVNSSEAIKEGAAWYVRKPINLEDLGTIISDLLAQDVLLRATSVNAKETMRSDQALVWRYHERENEFRLAAWSSSSLSETDKIYKVSGDNAQLTSIVKAEGPAFIPDIASSSAYHSPAWAKEHGWKAVICVPLQYQGECLGLIESYTSKASSLTAEPKPAVEKMLRIFAQQSAASIGNALLAQKIRKLINGVGNISAEHTNPEKSAGALLDMALDLTGAEEGCFYFIRFEEKDLKQLAGSALLKNVFPASLPLAANNIASKAAQEGVLQVANNVKRYEKGVGIEPLLLKNGLSQIAVPLKHGERTLGVILLTSARPNAFSASDRSILRLFTQLAGAALDPAKLRMHLQHISEAMLNKQIDLQQVVIHAIQDLTGKPLALWRFSRETNELTVAAGIGISDNFKKNSRIKYTGQDDSLIAHAFRTGEPVNCPDLTHPEPGLTVNLRELLQQEQWRSALIVPIFDSERQPVGAIALKNLAGRPSDEYEVEFLSNFAYQVAIAFEAQERAENLARQFAAVREIVDAIGETTPLAKIVQKCAELIGADYGSIAIQNVYRNAVVLQAVWQNGEVSTGEKIPQEDRSRVSGIGIAGHVAIDGNPYYSPDLSIEPAFHHITWREDTRSKFIVPLKNAHKQLIGVLDLESRARDAFSLPGRNLIQNLAQVAAEVVEKSELFFHKESFARQSQALHEVVQAENLIAALQLVALSVAEFMGPTCTASIVQYDERQKKFIGDPDQIAAAGPFADKVHFPPRDDKGMGWYAVFHKHPLFIEDINNLPEGVATPFPDVAFEAAGIQSSAVLPLMRNKHVFGLLFIDQTNPAVFPADLRQMLATYADQAAIAIDMAQRALQRSSERLALKAILDAVASQDPEVLNRIVEQILAVMPGEYCSMWMEDPDNPGDLILKAYSGPRDEITLPEDQRLKAGQPSISMEVFQQGEVMITLPDVSQEPQRYHRVYKSAKSSLTVPLRFHAESIGSLNVESRYAGAFSKDNEDLLCSFADQAAIAIKLSLNWNETKREVQRQTEELRKRNEEINKRTDDLFHMNYRLERRNASFAALTEVGQLLTANVKYGERQILEIIQRQASRIMDTGNMYIALYEPERDQVHFELAFIDDRPVDILNDPQWAPRSSGNGRTEWIIRYKTSILTYTKTDAEAWYRQPGTQNYIGQTFASWLGVPIMFSDEVMGVIATYHRTEDYKYDPDDMKILTLMGRQAAIAMQNARLLRNIDTLRALGEDLSQSGLQA